MKYAFSFLAYCFPVYELKIWEFEGGLEWGDKDDIRDALRWLFEEKLNWSYEDITKNISKHTFIDNGMRKMFLSFFRGSTYRAMNFLYPDRSWEALKKNEGRNFKNQPDYSFSLYRSSSNKG